VKTYDRLRACADAVGVSEMENAQPIAFDTITWRAYEVAEPIPALSSLSCCIGWLMRAGVMFTIGVIIFVFIFINLEKHTIG